MAKESDRVLVPKFPQPANYRNWRIRVRDAVIAASVKPDLAFQWIEEVFIEVAKPAVFEIQKAATCSHSSGRKWPQVAASGR